MPISFSRYELYFNKAASEDKFLVVELLYLLRTLALLGLFPKATASSPRGPARKFAYTHMSNSFKIFLLTVLMYSGKKNNLILNDFKFYY
jgi:hypothetical protein